MDSGSAGAGNQLLHVDIYINEHEPRRGILDLLSRLRPHWKAKDIQMKATVQAFAKVWRKTLAEAVREVDSGQLEESEREEFYMAITNEMERRGLNRKQQRPCCGNTIE